MTIVQFTAAGSATIVNAPAAGIGVDGDLGGARRLLGA